MKDEMPARPGLSMGWLTVFLWPVPVLVGLFLIRAMLAAIDAQVLTIGVSFGVIVGLCAQLSYVLSKWLGASSAGDYDCPVCGRDIVNTPHSCPECGTRLIWGHLPGPGDGRHPQVAGHEHRCVPTV